MCSPARVLPVQYHSIVKIICTCCIRLLRLCNNANRGHCWSKFLPLCVPKSSLDKNYLRSHSFDSDLEYRCCIKHPLVSLMTSSRVMYREETFEIPTCSKEYVFPVLLDRTREDKTHLFLTSTTLRILNWKTWYLNQSDYPSNVVFQQLNTNNIVNRLKPWPQLWYVTNWTRMMTAINNWTWTVVFCIVKPCGLIPIYLHIQIQHKVLPPRRPQPTFRDVF